MKREKNSLKHKLRASALLIALIIMGSLGVAAMSAAKVFFTESSVSQSYSDTMAAYYAAESALEKSLLMYARDANVQLSAYCTTTIDSGCPAEISSPLYRFPDLSSDVKIAARIYRSGSSFTDDNGLKQDESRQFMIYNGATASLSWSWVGSPPADAGLRISYIDPNTGKSLDDDYFRNGTEKSIFPSQSDTPLQIPSNGSDPVLVRFRPLGADLASYTFSVAEGSYLDTGVTTIEARGRYKDVAREIRVKIDRTAEPSKILNSLFDYTLLSDETI